MTLDLEQIAKHCAFNSKLLYDKLIVNLKGRKVKIKTGKYKDRVAIIDGICFSCRTTEPLYLCMVTQSKDHTKILDDDGESRSYRPFTDFEVMK